MQSSKQHLSEAHIICIHQMNFEEQLASWEIYQTSLLTEELDSAVSSYLLSNHSNISASQCQNNDSGLLQEVLKLHSTLTPQEVQVCTSNSSPSSTLVRKDAELVRNRKNKRRQEHVEIPPTFVNEDGEDEMMLNDKHESFCQSSKVIRRMFERKRRKRITDKMKSLQDLLPHCSDKLGADSVLDKSIDYIRNLQRQIQSICSSGNLFQYVPQMPLQVPHSSPYIPTRAGSHDFSTMGTSNMTLPASVTATVTGVPCNLMRPGLIIPQALTGPSYYAPQYQVQIPMFNPFQQMQQVPAQLPNMQQMSYPMSSMVQDFDTNSLSCPQLSGLSDISEEEGTRGRKALV